MTLEEIGKLFGIKGEMIESEHITAGYINVTYRIRFEYEGKETDYILQRMNKYVFKDPVGLMENIVLVTDHIRKSLQSKGLSTDRYVLQYLHTTEDKYYIIDEEDEYWRSYIYVPNSVTYNSINNMKIMEESGRAFGEFQNQLSDFDATKLHETIPMFHDTINRFKNLRNAAEKDEFHRFEEVKDVFEEYMKVEEISCKLTAMLKAGELPLRVTHNDTKCNNVLFDIKSDEALAVIDLDTVMPGLAAFDYGDSMRSGGATAKDDEQDLSLVSLDLTKYEAFTKGFLSKTKDSLTKLEIETLPYGAIAMTAECGSRFLCDYLEGDVYFHARYDKQNFIRAKNQLKLAQDMISKLDAMKKIVEKYK